MVQEIAWGDGTGGKIYLTLDASAGNQTVLVSSDANTGAARSKTVTFSASGVSPVTLTVNQAAGSPVLPTGYTELAYVENPLGNSAYIRTGIIPTNDTGFYIDAISYDAISSSGYGCFFGGRYRANQRDFQFTSYCVSPNSGTIRRGGSSQNYNAHLPSSGTRFVAELKGTQYTIDNTSYTGYNSNFTNGKQIYLFSLNHDGSSQQNGHIRMYRFKLFSGDTLVLDYLPCKRDADDVVGFYDLVAEAFVPPYSGTFTGGTL